MSYRRKHTGHLFKQLDTLNTSLVELLTQVSLQERKKDDIGKTAEQLIQRNKGLHQLVAGIKYRETFNEKLKLLEQKMMDILFSSRQVSILQQGDGRHMVSRSLLIIGVDYCFIGNKMLFLILFLLF